MSTNDNPTGTITNEQHLGGEERLELLDLLLEAGADGFFDWHVDLGKMFYSSRFEMILGYDDESLPKAPTAWLDLLHPEDRGTVAQAFEDLVAGVWPFDVTLRMRHRVTGWRWFRARAAAHRNLSGTATRIVATFSDISDRVRAERRQMSLVNALPDLLIRVQNDSTIIDVKTPEGNAGYAKNVAKLGEKLFESPFASSWVSPAVQALANAVAFRKETHFEALLRPDNDEVDSFDIEVRVLPSSEDESLFVIRDITAQKRQREQGLQSQKLEAIGQLAAGIAHEINTPLQFVGDNLHFLVEATDAFLQALERYRASTSEECAPMLKAMESSLDIEYMTEHVRPAFSGAIDGVQRVSVIVQAMKAFSHPGAAEKRPEDLNHAIETTITLSTNVWKYVADIERDFAEDLPKVDCVVGEVNQVFLNLITNAAHAIGDVVGQSGTKGKIVIATRIDGDVAEIRISDSGRGIPNAVRGRIFEPFFTTKPVGQGTGQGLPLARAIVVQHRGTLDFETREGHGTTFVVRLPIAQAADSKRNGSISQ